MSRRNLSGSSLSGSALLRGNADSDPMESMGNLMDVMLVFVCGLLLALIANWGVDITSTAVDTQKATPLDAEVSQAATEIDTESSDFSEVGTVYKDEKTGELYIVK